MNGAQPPTSLLAEAVGRWRDRPVLVIGDVMLDEWRFTDPQRLDRESAAPVVRLSRRQDSPGGAANTAVNLATLGARPTLVGPVGADDAARRVRAGLARAGADDATVTLAGYRTPRRSRTLAGGRLLLCEEEGPSPGGLPGAGSARLVTALEEAFEGALAGASEGAGGPAGRPAVLLVCDYGTAALDDGVRAWLVAHRQSFAVVGLDAHDLCRWHGLAPTLITPSYREAEQALGRSWPSGLGHGSGRVAAAVRGGTELLRRTGAEVVAVTLDVDGSAVVTADGASYRTRTRPASGSGTAGAGDAYFARWPWPWPVAASRTSPPRSRSAPRRPASAHPGPACAAGPTCWPRWTPGRRRTAAWWTPRTWPNGCGATATAGPGSCSPTAVSTCSTTGTSAT
jgi:D-beta-D-heptose 7-phosphate kinase / D-beta-D-heptose 1-phosphate adenosyltransferase